MSTDKIFSTLHQQSKQHNHRQLVVVAGDRDWGQACISTYIQDMQVTRIGESGNNAWLHPSQVVTLLGSETSCIVFDAYDSFDVNAFGAISGTLTGGGLLFLLIPDLDNWPSSQPAMTGFLKRLTNMIVNGKQVSLFQQGKEPRLSVPGIKANATQVYAQDLYKTQDQKTTVNTIVKMAKCTTPYPVVVTAARGRGKSAALGIAAAQLMSAGISRIIITAPRFEVSKVFFQHLKENLNNAKQHRGCVSTSASRCQFAPPDKLFQNQNGLNPELPSGSSTLLLVDEAAAIPAFILQRLLHNYPAIVFATTTHGYEGSGQGFFIRFQQTLDHHNANWVTQTLQTPIRWADNDPLENFTNGCLLLDAVPATIQKTKIPTNKKLQLQQLYFAEINRDKLVSDEQQLTEIAGLLKQAHYRTRPSDMVQLLDAPKTSLIACYYQKHVIAIMWYVSEGKLSKELTHQVYCGKRRPDGHLIPQSLAHHAGIEDAAILSYSRIVRIVVHPEFHRMGIGSQLLRKHINTSATDIVGASFGATPELLKFWQTNGFVPARLGLKRNASSGTNSLIMLRPVNEHGSKMVALLNHRFSTQITDYLKLIQPALDHSLAQQLRGSDLPQDENSNMSDSDWKDTDSFIQGHRGLELNIYALKKLVLISQTNGEFFTVLSNQQQSLLNDKLKKMQVNQTICSAFGFTGKQELDNAVKAAITLLACNRNHSKLA